MRHEQGLEALHAAHYAALRAYALRRTDSERAQEVVAEVFVIAWRRFDDIPDDALPWLYGVARRVLANQRRGDARRAALDVRLREHLPARPGGDPSERLAGDPEGIHAALASLSERDREALLLVAWEGLEPAVAARAFGCSRTTFAVRLHRARKRLAAALEAQDVPNRLPEPVEAS